MTNTELTRRISYAKRIAAELKEAEQKLTNLKSDIKIALESRGIDLFTAGNGTKAQIVNRTIERLDADKIKAEFDLADEDLKRLSKVTNSTYVLIN